MDFHKIKKLMAEKFKEDPDFVYGFPTLAQAGALENCKWWTKNFSRIQSEGFGDFLCLLAAGWWTPKSYNALHSTAKKFSVESLEHAKFAEQNGRGMIRPTVAQRFIKKNDKKIVQYVYPDGAIGHFYITTKRDAFHYNYICFEGFVETQTKLGTEYIFMPTNEYQIFIKQLQSLFREMRLLDEKSRNERKGVETANRLKSLVKFGTEQEILRDSLEQIQTLIPKCIEVLSAGEANKKDITELSNLMNSSLATIQELTKNRAFFGVEREDTKSRIDEGIVKRYRKKKVEETSGKPGRKK